VNELMLREMLTQPADLARALIDLRAHARGLRLEDPVRIVLTGSGDSGYAASAVELAYSRYMGRPVWAVPSASAARYGDGRIDGLTVVISVSGEVRRTIEAAMAAKNAGGHVVAVTTAPGSTLAGLADAALIMPEPITRATPHTRDYTLTLLTLLVLLEALSGRRIAELDAWPDKVAAILGRAMPWADHIAERHAGRKVPVWFLGLGPDRATASYGALKFWEGGGMAAWWDDLEEFGHGSQLISRPGQLAVLFSVGAARSRAEEMRAGLERMGLEPVVIGGSGDGGGRGFDLPGIPDELSPLLTSLPPQALAYSFATRRGIDVGLPLGGTAEGELFEAVHRDWMRTSHLEPVPPAPTR
jgi:glucosamine--fructose-6-phosphate aminotransferase (isomerizing)